MDILIYIVCAILCIGGFVGCFIPMIPGPPLAFIGYLILMFTPASEEMSVWMVLMLGLLTVLTIIFDYVIPTLGVKWFGGTKYGKWGSFIGTFAGLLYLPVGLILGPFIGAFVGEMLGNSSVSDALKSGIGSLVGFLCGTLFKVIVCIAIICYAFAAIF